MCRNKIILIFTLTIFPLKSNESHSNISASKTALYLLMGSSCTISLMLKWESLHCCFCEERQPMKQMKGWENILKDNRYTYMKQLACVICFLQKRQFSIITSYHQGVNKNHKTVTCKWIIKNWTCHAIITFFLVTHIKWKRTLNKWYTPLDSYQFFLVTIFFKLSPCTICVNTQISKAVLATAFESDQSIASTILPATRIKNHAFFVFHPNSWHTFQACNQVFSHPSPLCIYILLLQQPCLSKQNWDLNLKRCQKKINLICLGLIKCSNFKLKWIPVNFLCLKNCPVSLHWILINEYWDMLRCVKWSCCFEETKMKNVMSVK